MIRSLIDILVVTALAFSASACSSTGGGGGLPTGPSGPSGSATSGAVISGTVTGRRLSTAKLGPTLDGPATMTVTVGGTSTTAAVDASGHFEISGVPEGNVELMFNDASSAFIVVIMDVAPHERIQIRVDLASGTPDIIIESRSM